MAPLGVYVHVPFCARRCSYCDFFVVAGPAAGLERRLARALAEDIRLSARLQGLGGQPVDTLYFGGGTPSRLQAGEVARIVAAVREVFEWREPAEVTLEANPEGLDAPKLAALREAGVNRLSLGVQTLDDAALRALGRLHGEAEVHAAARAARRSGFSNLNFDLICGLPGLGLEPWIEGIERLLEHAPEHVSIYTLDMDKDTPLRRAAESGSTRLPAEERTLEAFEAGARVLEAAGYERYEVSNFARPGGRSRHNLKYWTDMRFLGVGPSAWSYLQGGRVRRVADLERYLAGVEASDPPCEPPERNDPDARLAEAVVLGLRLRDGVDLAERGREHGRDAWARYGETVRRLTEEGWIETSCGRIRLTPAALPVANEIWEQFI